MLYAMIGEDVPNSATQRTKARPEHLRRLEALQAEGRLIMAGPFPAIDAADPGPAGFSGSLIVAEFTSLAEAETWFAADAYAREGVFAKTTVRPFRQTFPK